MKNQDQGQFIEQKTTQNYQHRPQTFQRKPKQSLPKKSSKEAAKKKRYFSEAKCSQGNRCVFVCAQKNCEKNVIVCADQECACREPHQSQNGECFLIEPEALVRKAERNILYDEQMEKYLKKATQKIIDWISDFEERYNYLGLSEEQTYFLKNSYQSRFHMLTGKQIHYVSRTLNTQKRYIDIQETHWALKQTWAHAQTVIKNQFLKIPTIIHNNYTLDKSNYQSHLPKHQLIDSKIIQTSEELSILKSFLPHTKSVLSFRLLYRATQNKFLVDKFYEKCSKIPNTVLLIRNEFDKKIGGYTPIEWNQEEIMYKADLSGESCVFSITDERKFQLLVHEYPIRSLSAHSQGPMFGVDELTVRDKSNAFKRSSAFAKHYAYGNGQFQGQQQQEQDLLQGIRRAFVGSEEKQFHIKEWEVYQVIYQ